MRRFGLLRLGDHRFLYWRRLGFKWGSSQGAWFFTACWITGRRSERSRLRVIGGGR
jgi:hypothetical protein